MSPLVIYDARSWVAAKANMLNGKGTENESYYKCKLHFLDIENIHKVRDAYKDMKRLCLSHEVKNWFTEMAGTNWYDNVT